MIVTVCGPPGAGKSTVGRALAKKLGFKVYSTGEIIRKLAVEKNISLVDFLKQCEQDSSPDREIDDYVKKLGETEDDFVLESRLGFHFIPNSVKIFLDADIQVRAERILERDAFEEHVTDINEAITVIKEREGIDVKRYEKLYGVDPFEHNHFDLVIDTSKNTSEQTADMIYRFVSTKIKK